MRGFIKFNKGVMRSPVAIKLWLAVLVAANLVGPLFFLSRIEAQIILGTFLLGACLMSVLTARFGFTRLLGLGHVLWFPMLGWLWFRLGLIPPDDPFGLWIRGVMCLNGLSLIMDVVDVVRFAGGDRKELVEGI